jgi:hypothetical protein
VEESRAGWLVRWGSEAAARGLARWLRAGFEARVLVRPIGVDPDGSEQEFPAGTVVLAPRRDRQLVAFEEVEPLLTAIITEEGIGLVPVASSLTPSGPDLGGPSARLIGLPEVAILTGDGLSSNRAGELWHLLDHGTGMPVSLLDQDRISGADLDRYGVIFVAGGTVSESELQPLFEWVKSGGTLIALGSSMAWAVREGLLQLEERPFDVDSLTADADWADLGVARGTHAIAGTILRSRLDGSHPLAFGIGEGLPLFVTSGQFFDASPKESIATYEERPRLSGWLSGARESQATGATAIAVSRQGSGRVIGIHAYPAFRGYWKGGARLIWNAVFFGPGL